MKTRYQYDKDESFKLSVWGCVASLMFAVGCGTLAALSLDDVIRIRFTHPSLIDELPFGKILTLFLVAIFMGFCAFANAAILYANIKCFFIGIYNLIFKKQTYKFRK